MAASDAAVPSALGGRPDLRSPPPSLSKRDRKRLAVMDRLAVLSERFQHDKDSTFRDQLQRIQFELNKLQKLNPYAVNATEVVGEIQREYNQAMGAPVRAENGRSLMEMAGMQFPQFLTELQDLLETRDFQLTESKNEYDHKVQEYKNTHLFKMETAKREHDALNETMRDRLINQLNNKKSRLRKKKDAFDINDTNALLLNPAQFSLTNPGSPAGHTGKRSTRNRKEADDSHTYGDGKKRKRNTGDEDGSPAPARRALDANSTTPYWQSEKARNEAKKQGGGYTVGSLFTDKELSMHYNTAAVAAQRFILRFRPNGNASSPESSDSGNGDNNNGSNVNDTGDADSQPSAPVMERQISHATRSTRGAANSNVLDDRVFGIEALTNFELPHGLDLMRGQDCNLRMPSAVPFQYMKNTVKNAELGYPDKLPDKDVVADLQIMSYLRQYDQSRGPGSHLDNPKGIRKMFEAVATSRTAGKYVAIARAGGEREPEVLGEALGVNGITSSVRDQPSPGRGIQPLNMASAAATPMSRQSSAGGVAMSRQGLRAAAESRHAGADVSCPYSPLVCNKSVASVGWLYI